MTDQNQDPIRYFSTPEAAAYCGLTPRRIKYRVERGRIKPAMLEESSEQHHLYVFSKEQLDDLLANGNDHSDVEPPDLVDSSYIMAATGLEKSTIIYHVQEGRLSSWKVSRYHVYARDAADKFVADRLAEKAEKEK